MDMLYRAYSNPLDLMYMYINQGRFGKFVTGFLEAEDEKRKAEAEKDNDWMLWTMYIHSYSDKSFNDWKDAVLPKQGEKNHNRKTDSDLDEADMQSIITKLFPS